MNLQIDDATIEVGTGGRPINPNKPAIVFIHGAGMDHTNWMCHARAYAYAGWTVLAPDLPAHGRSTGTPLRSIASMAAWIIRLLDTAQIPKAAIVGHSMGGAIALDLAATYPNRITHIGIIGSGTAIPVSPTLLDAAAQRTQDAYDMMTTWAHAPGARIGGNPTPGLWMTGMTRAIFNRNRPGILATDLTACNDWITGSACAAVVKCAAIIVGAQRDAMTPARRSADLAQAIHGAKLIIIDGAGHMILSEAPTECLNALRTTIY